MNQLELPAYRRLPRALKAACGDELVMEGGAPVLDLYGGHCVNTLGAANTEILEAVSSQWNEVSFATNYFAHDARERFFDAFDSLMPPERDGSWQVFLSNSGAEANENALKAVLAGGDGRNEIVCFEGGFHGRTAACEAVSDMSRRGFPRAPFVVVRVPFGDLDALVEAICGHTAGVILEPIQSLAGIVEPPPGYLEALRARCDEVGAKLIFDEVQTGNGRLGVPFASHAYGVIPDAFTTAKGAGGGLPIGVTVLSQRVAEGAGDGLFGSTFGGGPTVLAAAAVVAEHLADSSEKGILANVRKASAAFRQAGAHGPVARVRGEGLLLGLELEAGNEAAAVKAALLESGVMVGASNDPRVLRLTPALNIAPERAAVLQAALTSLSSPAECNA